MSKKSIVKIGLIGVVASMLLSGCVMDEFARKYSPDNVGNMLANSLSGKSEDSFQKEFSDEFLGKKFVEFYKKDGYSFGYTKDSISIEKQLVYFSQNVYMENAFSYVQNNASENNLAKVYKDAIVERGNKCKIFTGKFHKKVISTAFGRELSDVKKGNQRYLKWDLIPLIAEFNQKDELVSLMLAHVEIGAAFDQINNPSVQSEIILRNMIYVNSALTSIKNNISKKDWDDNLISEYKK